MSNGRFDIVRVWSRLSPEERATWTREKLEARLERVEGSYARSLQREAELTEEKNAETNALAHELLNTPTRFEASTKMGHDYALAQALRHLDQRCKMPHWDKGTKGTVQFYRARRLIDFWALGRAGMP